MGVARGSRRRDRSRRHSGRLGEFLRGQSSSTPGTLKSWMSFSSAPALVNPSTAPSVSLLEMKSLNLLATTANFIPLATIFPSMIFASSPSVSVIYIVTHFCLFGRQVANVVFIGFDDNRHPSRDGDAVALSPTIGVVGHEPHLPHALVNQDRRQYRNRRSALNPARCCSDGVFALVLKQARIFIDKPMPTLPGACNDYALSSWSTICMAR